ncbi:MAG: gephyrin-like molybdotransferase Glp [Anaerolineae bacterium]|uniref:molybdopterin molybdotransferase MoeA n=1 Tax=Candidatus Amarolinea dominans TaxID=3140696 RepID=UPI00313699EF|nr:molybdopterin molybdotransferase MoeA [Anaerolineae bacterium]
MPESPYVMLSVDAALRLVLAHASRLTPVRLPLRALGGRALAEDIVSAEAIPPFAAAAKDGYAVIAADGPGWRRLVGEQMAGYVGNERVTPGAVVRITTGAPLPPGADAVVMVEQTQEQAGLVEIQTGVAPLADVRPPGIDLEVGQRVLSQGQRLGPAEIGLLASLGLPDALVFPAPRVAVLSTGDELRSPGETLAPGQIRDSNRFSLMAAVQEAGGEPLDLGIARDRQGDLEACIRDGLLAADTLVTSGGVSMGQLDLLKPLLEMQGTVHFGRVNMKPGKPLTFATIADKPVFALPGFPVSSLVAFELFVRPALLQMQGRADLARLQVAVRLTHAVHHDPQRWEFVRAVVRREGDALIATTTGSQSSGRLLSMVGANALLQLAPAGNGTLPAGALVSALLLNSNSPR